MHLAVRYPFAGVVWQLLHHLVGFRELGFDVYYVEDHGAPCYNPLEVAISGDPTHNLNVVGGALDRFGFAGRWGFLDSKRKEYVGMPGARCDELVREADLVINLCGASRPRDEYGDARLLYLETDPGGLQGALDRGEAEAIRYAAAHKLFFTYGYNIGEPDCVIPSAGIEWHKTRPPVLLDEWHPGIGPESPRAFTTVGTWRNKGGDVDIRGELYRWSKHLNFEKLLEVARRADQPIEIATDLDSGPTYERALEGGFSFVPVVPMSLDIDDYRNYICSSRGEFTASKDLYVRTRSGWFSDRTACYLAAGRPAVTQFTGFEKYLPTGEGLLGFHGADDAAAAIRAVNSDYARHAARAREIAREYFDAARLLDEIARTAGL